MDDLIFVMSTPEHWECAGFEGGCDFCAEYHGWALKVQEMWQEKARRLIIPLSAKGRPVGQRRVFTGVAIDTYRGRFNMLTEKLWSMVAERDGASRMCPLRGAFPASEERRSTTCAISFVAVAAPSLSQLMHDRETGTGPVENPTDVRLPHRPKSTAMTAGRCAPPRSSPTRTYAAGLGRMMHGSR